MEVSPFRLSLLAVTQREKGTNGVDGRMLVGAEEWCVEKPWLVCRKKGRDGGNVAEEAGCACFECWPKHVKIDTRVCIQDPRLRRG